MTEQQIYIADKILSEFSSNNGTIYTSVTISDLDDALDYKCSLDLLFVMAALERDYHLIEPLGTACMRWTRDGERAARLGFTKYARRLTFVEFLSKYRIYSVVISAISAVIGVLLSTLLSHLL